MKSDFQKIMLQVGCNKSFKDMSDMYYVFSGEWCFSGLF